MIYSFWGISLVTQNYINPAIDTIKKKGIVSTFLNISNLCLDWFGHHERHTPCFLELSR